MKKTLTMLATVALFLTSFGFAQFNPSFPNNMGGRYIASEYGKWSVHNTNSVVAGAGSMTLDNCFVSVGTGNKKLFPFAVNIPVNVIDGTSTENGLAVTAVVTPAAASGPSTGGNPYNCSFSATFANAHGVGPGVTIVSGDSGLEEAIDDAAGALVSTAGYGAGSGTVVLDSNFGGTNSTITAAVVNSGVILEDLRTPQMQYWIATPGASTFLAVPTVLSASTAVPSATPVGSYTTGTYFMCIAYVDVAGQEGACSTTFSQAGLATGSFVFAPPAASTGAVGYTIYISLTGGTYSLAYQVPLTSSVCTLTKVETITPACAVTNTTYAQTGATATVTTLTVNTSPVDMQLGGVSGTLLTGNPNGRTTYAYAPTSHVNPLGVPVMSLAFTAGGIGSATPISIGTVNLPANLLNYVGRTIRVCGTYLDTDVNSSTQTINLYWDAAGSNTAGSPVKLTNPTETGPGTAAPYKGQWCSKLTTTVSGASVTAGSILPSEAILEYALISTGVVVGRGADTTAAAVGSLNLAGGAGFSSRLSIVHNNATGNNTPQLQVLTIEVL